MGLVKKENDHLTLLEGFDSGKDSTDDTAKGGLIGILGGPFGALLGGSVGELVGSATDSDDVSKNVSMLERVDMKTCNGMTMLTALVQELNESELGRRVGKLKTTILRFDAAVIAGEAEEAEKLQKEMAKEAKRKLREEKAVNGNR